MEMVAQASQEANATGMETYCAPRPPAKGRIIGLDCHPDIHTAAVFVGSTVYDARKLSTRGDLSLEQLLEWAGREFTREDLFLMEASANSFEIQRRLIGMGLRAVVLESAYVGKHAKTYVDNDKMAAARIVLVYLGGKAPCVWLPDSVTCERRQLLHAYQRAVKADTAAGNALKGYLNQFTVRLGNRGLHLSKTRAWVFGAYPWTNLQRQLLEELFEELQSQRQRRERLLRLIAVQVSREPLMLRCMKLLGIAVINAFALMAIIGDVRRFERPEKLVAYIGLNPGRRTSGTDKKVKVGIGGRGRGDMRALLIQGAQSVLRQGRATAIGTWGLKLFARKGVRNVVIAAVARKMVVQVWHLLSGNPPTGLEPEKGLATKLQKLSVLLGKELRVELGLPGNLKQCVAVLHARMSGTEATPTQSEEQPV